MSVATRIGQSARSASETLAWRRALQVPGPGGGDAVLQALVVVALGVAAVLAADLTPVPTLATWAGVGMALVGVIGSWAAVVRARRILSLRSARDSLANLVGRGERVVVKGRGWRGRWTPRPERLQISYEPGLLPGPDWTTKIGAQLAVVFEQDYALADRDGYRHRLVYVRMTVVDDAPVPALAERAFGMVENLFGKSASGDLSWDGDRLVAVDVTHDQKVTARVSGSVSIRNGIERTWQAMLPGRWRGRWNSETDTVRLEVRPPFPEVLKRTVNDAPSADRVAYAVDEDGRVLFWNLASSSTTPHMLIMGGTGTGKTNTMRGIIADLARVEPPPEPEEGKAKDRLQGPPRILLCDPKRVEYAGFRGWPNVEVVATSVQDIVATIRYVHREMERRYALLESGEAKTRDFPRIVMVLDEYRYFYGVCNTWYATVKPRGGSKICPIFDEVFAIASLGRTAEVHLLLGTQRPDAAWLGGDNRDQFACRFSLGRLSPQGAAMTWDAHHIGVSVPRGIPGRGTSVYGDEYVEAQAFFTPDPRTDDPSELALLEALRPATTTWEAHVIVPPPEADDAGEPIDPAGRYEEYANAAYEPALDHPDLVAAQQSADALLAVERAAALADTSTEPDDERDADYADPVDINGGDVVDHEGWLLLVDEATGTWGVIDSVEPDLFDDDGAVAISWRGDRDEDGGLLSVDPGTGLTVREPLEKD